MIQYCGIRSQYYESHSGLCVLPPNHDGDHLIEMVTVDTQETRYDQFFRR